MIKTDVENYFMKQPGVIVCSDETERIRVMSLRKAKEDSDRINSQINNMQTELTEIKGLLHKLLEDRHGNNRN